MIRRYGIILLVTITALIFSCGHFVSEKPVGESTMDVQAITLEQFNDPEFMLGIKSHFDVADFKKNVGTGEYTDAYSFTRPDGIKVVQQDLLDGEFKDTWTRDGSHFEYERMYNAKGDLVSLDIRFAGALIEESVHFNDGGEIAKTVDMYQNHKVHIKELRSIIKEELNVDIYDTTKVYSFDLGESKSPSLSYYELTMYQPHDREMVDQYLIDGNSGKALFKIEMNLRRMQRGDYREEPDILQQYQDHLKEVGQQRKKE